MRNDGLEVIESLTFPATGVYTTASLYTAWESISTLTPHPRQITVAEAFVQVTVAGINSIPAIIGGLTLAYGAYLADQRRRIKDVHTHEFRMAILKAKTEFSSSEIKRLDPDFPFDNTKTAAPSDDTIDMP